MPRRWVFSETLRIGGYRRGSELLLYAPAEIPDWN
jgi:hypothetical protein